MTVGLTQLHYLSRYLLRPRRWLRASVRAYMVGQGYSTSLLDGARVGAGDFKAMLAARARAAVSYLREAGELLRREYLRDRRRARRREIRLPVTLRLTSEAGGAQHARTAYTRDLSPEGLSLLLPAEVARGSTLDLTLELPRAPVRAAATVVRCEPLDEADARAGYLVAAAFSRVSAEDRQRLYKYLRRARSF